MRVVTFGELMLRLTPKGYYRFFQKNDFDASFGGGEANVSVSLSNLGVDSSFVTKLPENQIADAAIRELKSFSVDTSFIKRGGDRMGIYFLEKGASQRSSEVIYDRTHTSISTSSNSDYDWETIFKGSTWFHFTGITPALDENMVSIVMEACKEAKKQGLTISCDINYRKKLWSIEKARDAMIQFAPYIDVLIANEEDADNVYGIRSDINDVTDGELSYDGYVDIAKKLIEKYEFKKVVITLRESINANNNNWSGLIYEDSKAYFSKIYNLNIVDRVGGGDSLAAGLIYGLSHGYDNQKVIDFAVAASCLKHSIEGDYNRVTLEEVNRLLQGDGSGRVQR